jgi:Tfp pilus assembly protein PilN
MERLEQLLKQWRQQDEALRRMGIHVEAARMLEKLAETLPPGVSLLSMTFEVDELPLALPGGSRAAIAAGTTIAPALDRKLRIRVQGVAPTDVELASLLTDLTKVPFFDRVTPTYTRDRREAGHIMREFELTFQVNLNTPRD